MLGFFDESGDPGLKVGSGSSRFFVTALVTFADETEALSCDRRIDALRSELNLAASYEFHYSKNSKRVRESFLGAVQRNSFGYHTLVLDKDLLRSQEFTLVEVDIYSYITGVLFGGARQHLNDLTVVMDKRGSRKYRTEVSRYLRNLLRTSTDEGIIKKLSVQDSHRNNLLQLADYVASVHSRAVAGDSYAIELRGNFLQRKQITNEFWPK